MIVYNAYALFSLPVKYINVNADVGMESKELWNSANVFINNWNSVHYMRRNISHSTKHVCCVGCVIYTISNV